MATVRTLILGILQSELIIGDNTGIFDKESIDIFSC